MIQSAGTGSAEVESQGSSEIVPSGDVGYLARQPILDHCGRVFGYELHCHEFIGQTGQGVLSPSSNRMLDALALYGVKRLAAGSWAFINCSMDMLLADLFEALQPAMTVLEIPNHSEPPEKLIRVCGKLKKAGFRLALVDFEPNKATDPLIELVDYVKVDAKNFNALEWEPAHKQLDCGNVAVVADKVHTHQAYRRARALGIGYFQGLYFCHPELIPNGQIPANHIYHVEILRELFKDPLDLKTLCPLVSQDASLVYRVLRFVNSPLCAIRHPVTSIQEAIMILGDAAFRRIAALAIQSALSQDHSPELLQMALVRARFCAAAAPLCGLDVEEQYLLGMLSLLPPMLRVPMVTIVQELPLRAEIRNALAGIPGKERCLLTWIENLEDNSIFACEETSEQYGLDRNSLATLYLNALEDGTMPERISRV
jgi:EAL and modified HD-GYP domain-containing signal transduction protein